MTRARLLIAVGVLLTVLSFFVDLPLNGIIGSIINALIAMALLIGGVAGIVNGLIQLRRFGG
jgi:hypothetical protein